MLRKKNRGVLDIIHNYFGEALFAKHGQDKKNLPVNSVALQKASPILIK